VPRILVVEDNPDIAEVIRHYLDRAGHAVVHLRDDVAGAFARDQLGRKCGGVLVDLSKNRSKRFCDAGCGNRAAVNAYRARRAARSGS